LAYLPDHVQRNNASNFAKTTFVVVVVSSRSPNHHTLPYLTEDSETKTMRPRDAKKVAFDAWFESTECSLSGVSPQGVIDSVVEFAELSHRDMTELEWTPAGMARVLKQYMADSSGRIIELPQGRHHSSIGLSTPSSHP
jgi:hypothetical protein